MPLTPFARAPPSRSQGSSSSGPSTPSRSTRRTTDGGPTSTRKSASSSRDLTSFLPSTDSPSRQSPRSVPLPESPDSFDSPSQASSSRRRTLNTAHASPAGRANGHHSSGLGTGGSRLRESVVPQAEPDSGDEDDDDESSVASEGGQNFVNASALESRPSFGTPLPRSQTLHNVASSSKFASTDSPDAFDSPSLAHQIRKSRSHMMLPSTPVRRDSDSESSKRTPGSLTASRSRSAITPFNMGANLQDGHKALERRKSQLLKGSPPKSAPSTPIGKLARWAGVTETPKGSPAPLAHRPKVVRRAPLRERLQNSVSELFEDLSDRFSTLPPTFALPLAIFLHLIHLLARAPLFAAKRRSTSTSVEDGDSVFRDSLVRAESSGSPLSWFGFGQSAASGLSDAGSVFVDEAAKRRRLEVALEAEEAARRYTGLWSRAGTFLIFLLLAGIAVANAYYLFNQRRRYDFRTRKIPINSPNARAVPAVDAAELQQQQQSLPPRAWPAKVWRFCRLYLAPKVMHKFVTGDWSRRPATGSSELMQRLEMWDPSEFNLLFFTYYSPLQPVLLQFMGRTHPWLALVSCYLLSLTLKLVVREYSQLIKDKAILQAEVMKEYNEGFVYKAMFTPRQDVGTQTSQAEMIW